VIIFGDCRGDRLVDVNAAPLNRRVAGNDNAATWKFGCERQIVVVEKTTKDCSLAKRTQICELA
jgi:hypothetical protein